MSIWDNIKKFTQPYSDEEEYDERPYAVGWFGAYWSSTLYEKYPDNAYWLTIVEDGDYTFDELLNLRYKLSVLSFLSILLDIPTTSSLIK